MWKTSTGYQEPTWQDKTNKQTKESEKREKVTSPKDDSIGIRIFKRGVDTGQMVIRVVSVRNKDNTTKTRDRK